MHAAKLAGAATQPSLTLVKAEAKEGGCCAGKAAAVAANRRASRRWRSPRGRML